VGFAAINLAGAGWSAWLRLLAAGGLTMLALLLGRIFRARDVLALKNAPNPEGELDA
jgi:hypothetical protein